MRLIHRYVLYFRRVVSLYYILAIGVKIDKILYRNKSSRHEVGEKSKNTLTWGGGYRFFLVEFAVLVCILYARIYVKYLCAKGGYNIAKSFFLGGGGL